MRVCLKLLGKIRTIENLSEEVIKKHDSLRQDLLLLTRGATQWWFSPGKTSINFIYQL